MPRHKIDTEAQGTSPEIWPRSLDEFESLVSAYQDRILYYAFRRLRDLQDAEDVVQDVFLRAYKRRANERPVGHVAAYLFRMTANACASRRRRREIDTVSLDEDSGWDPPSGAPGPADVLRAGEELRRIDGLLRDLPPSQAEAVRLRVLDELPVADIAVVLECPVATVKSRLRYAYSKLRHEALAREETPMGCRYFEKHLFSLLDGSLGKVIRGEIEKHESVCERCAEIHEQARRVLARMRPSARIAAPANFKERAVLAQAAQAVSGLRSVHVKARIRAYPETHSFNIVPDMEMIPHDMWKMFGDPQKWRVEKPQRIAVMDGERFLSIHNHSGRAFQHPPHEDTLSGRYRTWVPEILLDPQRIFEIEKQLAEDEEGSRLTISREKGPGGRRRLLLTVCAKAQGDFKNDYLRNKSVDCADNRRVYRFDPDTDRLESMRIYYKCEEGEVLVLETTSIDYDVPVDPSLFAPQLPERVETSFPVEILPDNERYARMKPEEAARAFFEACGREDWEEMMKFWPSTLIDETKTYLGGLEIVHLGDPFRSGCYCGFFVPYEIRLRCQGPVKKHNLALRRDNEANRWVVDGGI